MSQRRGMPPLLLAPQQKGLASTGSTNRHVTTDLRIGRTNRTPDSHIAKVRDISNIFVENRSISRPDIFNAILGQCAGPPSLFKRDSLPLPAHTTPDTGPHQSVWVRDLDTFEMLPTVPSVPEQVLTLQSN